MKVNEIFYSIDGEGLRTGELVIFIRLAGCNIRCSYCDTEYALKISQGEEMSIDDILNKIKEYPCKKITLTGGEPLIHKDVDLLINELLKNGYEVNIETNGTQDVSKYLFDNVIVTMDYKTLCSGMEKFNRLENLELLRDNDVLKFVVADRSELEKAKQILKDYNIKAYVYLSPVFGKIEASEIVEFMKENSLTGKVRCQLQLHKYIWDVNKRGV